MIMEQLGSQDEDNSKDILAEDSQEIVEILPPQDMLALFDGINIAGRSMHPDQAKIN